MELGQFLQVVGATGTGGQAKMLIQSGEVTLNGEVETRRRKKLAEGDRVSLAGQSWLVQLDPNSPPTSETG
ncbi:MAG: RNA-binding S4 domain-containing protein [Cyanobacteria bacterium P01_F01_bin.33]